MTDRPIALSCPRCGAELRAKRKARGTLAICPRCDGEIRVPEDGEDSVDSPDEELASRQAYRR